MSKIIGVTVGTTLPKPNFKQTDPTKGDYIKNKPDFDGLKSKVEQIEVRVDTMQESAYDDTELRGIVSENVAKIDTLNELVGNTNVETQIGDAVATLESEIDDKLNTMQSDIDSKVDAVDGMGLSTNDYTTAEKDKLATIEANANFYEHPTHDSHDSGLYKITVDESGHVSGATLAEKEDIVALGIPAQDTTYDEEISDLSDRIDDVENSINTTNETLNGVAQDFESYKTTNNESVSTNASGIEANKTAIEEIQKDYLTSTDRTQLQDGINEVSEKATANASAIEVLNGDGDGSVKQSIDNAFNEFAANVTNDDVVNTYKELIDYAAKHGPEFTELVGKVDTINTHVGEIETDLSNYKTTVSDQFTEVDTTINNHVTNTNNPHGVTKEQIGLANVDNTSDLEKPISNAAQEALDEKANLEHAHSDLYYDKDEIEELVTVEDIDDICGSNVVIGGGDANVVSYATKQWVQDGYQPKGNYLTSVPDGYATESYVNTKIAAIPTPDVSGQINTHNLATDAHNDIRILVDGLTTRLNTLADCDDATLDQMSEVVEYIKSNQSLIEGITTKKVNVADIIDNLTTNVSNKPLSAAQGVVLNGLIEELTSNLSNYQPKGDYLTAVPAGYATEEFVTAKIAEAELGGEEVDLSGYVTESEMQNYAQPKGDYLTSIPSEYITEKELENKGYLTEHQSLSDYATKKELPTKTSDLINDSGFLTTISVESVNGQTGAVVLDAASVGARPDTWMPSASEVGALPDTTVIPVVPDNISAFANDAGYLTEHQSLEGLATEEWVEEKFEEHSGFVAQPDAPEDTTVLWLDTDDDSESSGGNAVLYTEQSLTEEQKAQARANIGAAAEKETTVITPIVPTGNTGWYVETGGNSLQASIYEMYFYEPIKINSNMKTLRLKNIHFNPYMAKVIFSNSPTLDDHPDISVATINASSEGVISCDVDIDTNYQYMYISTNAGSSGYINDTGAEYYIISTVINESSNSQIINLAERYDIVENDTLELFYSGILNVGNIQNFIVECDCDVGETYQRKFMFTPSADHAGKTYDLTLTVRDTYGNVVESSQTTIVVAESQETTAQITPSGNAGFYSQPSGIVQAETAGFYFHSPIALNSNMKTLRLANVLVNPYVAKIAYSNSPTLTLYETLSVVTLEGNDGDIVSVDIEIDNSYQYLYISANCTSSGVIQDTGAAYYIVSGPDEQKSGNVLCIGDSLTAEGTWVKEFQNRLAADGFDRVSLIGSQIADVMKHEGHAGWGYGSYLARNESNPFWNASTSQIDFANYMTNLGLSGQSIDYCVILLGWNETELSEEAFKANVNTFCTNLRNAYPDCKIMFVGLQIPSVDGLGANYGTSWHWKEKCDFVHNLDRWYQDVVSTMENAKVVQLCGQFDTEHNMPTGTRQVNRRNPVTETYGTNGVHPNEYGYLQIADAAYRGFVGF